MKKKILGILVFMLVFTWSTSAVIASTNLDKQKLTYQGNSIKQSGNTLVTEVFLNEVIEYDYYGSIVWSRSGLNMPTDAERLSNGNTLITEMYNDRVIEVDASGAIVWQCSGLLGPWDAERLPNGNTLIADSYANRVIEVNSVGSIVWSKDGLGMPTDAERLDNGNTLITEVYADRVIEVDSSGTIVWQLPVIFPVDVERLSNGNTLITLYAYENRIIEVDSSGTIVWQYVSSSGFTFDAERLSNGNTLISEFYYGNGVYEVDPSGAVVWQLPYVVFPTDAERLSIPPNAPTIDGKTSGRTGKDYEYKFNAVDPDGDDVKYYIDWGDNNTEWTTYFSSGEDAKVKHSWSEKGDYTIKAKAVDINGAESEWGTLDITMPKNKPSNHRSSFLERIFNKWPNAFPILRYIMGL